MDVGAIIVATGFDTYQPEAGEFGYGIEGVLTLPDFNRLIKETTGPLAYEGKPVKDIAYVYCVGSREDPHAEVATGRSANEYCSRYCCAATSHAALEVSARDATVHQYHLYRDIRTYGKYELLFADARDAGSLFLKFPDDEPPSVGKEAGRLAVTVRDLLSGGDEVRIPVDLVVLVTGMVPRHNEDLVNALKLPLRKAASSMKFTPSSVPWRPWSTAC